jgi:hypothetical protein
MSIGQSGTVEKIVPTKKGEKKTAAGQLEVTRLLYFLKKNQR